MSNKVQILRSTAAGNVPSALLAGELAINFADKRLFVGDGTNILHLLTPDFFETDANHRFITDAQLATLEAGFTLPEASATVLGGVKVGSNIDVDGNGVISLLVASATNTGVLSNTDFATFTAKQDALGYEPVNKAGDTLTGALILSADPSAPLQAATKQYVDNLVAGVGAGVYGAPVADQAALTAITAANRIDKMLVPVEANSSIYMFESSSTLAAAGDDVLVPNDNPATGRWIRIQSSIQNHEALSGLLGGAANDHQHVTTAQHDLLAAITATATEINFLSGVTSGVQTQIDSKLSLAGGTLTGALILSADATEALEAVTFQQLNAAIGAIVIDGGTF